MPKRYLILFTLLLSISMGFSSPNAQVRLQLKWKHQFQFAGYYAAIEKGYYNAEGLDVKILEAIPGETPFDSVFGDKAEFGICTTDILVARDSGQEAVVVAIYLAILSGIALTAIFYYQNGIKLKREIQRRMLIEDELRNSEELYRSTIKASPDDVTIADINGIVKFVSQAGITLGGYDKLEELVGRPVADFLHPEDLPRALKNIAAMFQGTYNGPEEYRLIRKDGSIIAVESNAEIIRDGTGNPIGMVLIIRDIRERKLRLSEIQKVNNELRQSNAEKDKFFSIIAHDLRSPFTGLLGITQILLEGIDNMEKSEIKSFATDLNVSAKTLFRLLENLLMWTRVKRGLTTPKLAEFALDELISLNLKMFQTSAEFKGISLRYLASGEYPVWADRQMVETIVRNIVSNAIKYTPTGGNILISLSHTMDYMTTFTVQDSGIGMTEDTIDNLFRTDISVTRPGTEGETSSGLGLLLCKEFLDILGGEISVTSVEGKGSTFTIQLPRKKEIDKKGLADFACN